MVLEKTLESPLDCRDIKPVNLKGNQSWILIGRTDVEAETEAPILWPPDVRSWLIRKDPYAGKDWRQEEKGTTEDEVVGWHHRLNEHEFEQAPGDGEGQGSLECCSPWGRKESDTSEQLNNNNWNQKILFLDVPLSRLCLIEEVVQWLGTICDNMTSKYTTLLDSGKNMRWWM